jgi:transcriptional regulator with XRE-family HTH domain
VKFLGSRPFKGVRIPLAFFGDEQAGPTWHSRYRMDWAMVVGRRVRTLRQQRDLAIPALADEIRRADGRPYSPSFVSRLERGWASPPLFAYILLARYFDVAPGELLGSEGVERPITDAELTLIRVARNLLLSPEEAIVRLMGGGHATARKGG